MPPPAGRAAIILRRHALALLLALLLGLLSAAAEAHAPGPGPHGGQLQHLGNNTHVEVVARGNTILLYVFTPEDEPLATEGATATATVLAGGKTTRVPLQPKGGNLMQGSGDFASTPGMKVVVSITMQGGRPTQGRFTPLD